MLFSSQDLPWPSTLTPWFLGSWSNQSLRSAGLAPLDDDDGCHVTQAAALRGVMKTLAGVWIVSKQPGVLSRRADKLWCGGHTALYHRPPLTGKLIKCLIMSSPCFCSADCVGCWQRQPGEKLCLAPIAHGSATAQLWKAFPSGLRLISSRSISSMMCVHPPQRHAQCGHLGTCVPGIGTLC